LFLMEKKSLVLQAEKNEKDQCVILRWNDISTEHESFSYQLRRRTKGGEWQSRSIWNEEEHIPVLNVYPTKPYLEKWMTTPLSDSSETPGKGIFEIDSISMDVFNQKPEEAMKNKDGSWKYGVVFFGAADGYSNKDLSECAFDVMQQFVNDGRGVLFGHDTVVRTHPNFLRFCQQIGIVARTEGIWKISDTVSVLKFGTLTNYPWNVRGTLKVPKCHSTLQYVGGTTKGTEWMSLVGIEVFTDKETGAHSNFYLVTNQNLGMIQTGNTEGKATDDERKVLANTLFYLYQVSSLNTAKDPSFHDTTAPDIPEVTVKPLDDGSFEVTAESKDNGTTYEYSVCASLAKDRSNTVCSNVVKHEIKSGLAGFVVACSDSDQPQEKDLVKRDKNGEHVLNIVAADASGKAVVVVKPESKKYIHVFAVDHANNISEEYIVSIEKPKTEEPPKREEVSVVETPQPCSMCPDEKKKVTEEDDDSESSDDGDSDNDDDDDDDQMDPNEYFKLMYEASAKCYRKMMKDGKQHCWGYGFMPVGMMVPVMPVMMIPVLPVMPMMPMAMGSIPTMTSIPTMYSMPTMKPQKSESKSKSNSASEPLNKEENVLQKRCLDSSDEQLSEMHDASPKGNTA